MIRSLISRVLGRHISDEVAAIRERVERMTDDWREAEGQLEKVRLENIQLHRDMAEARQVSERRLAKWTETAAADGRAHADAIAKLTDCGLSAQNKGCGAKCLECMQRHVDGWMERAKKAEAEHWALTKDRDEWKRQFEMYARAWLRELGGKVFHKTHHIDSLVMTTEWMRRRSDRFEETHRLLKEARAQLSAIPPNPEGALLTLRKATE